ncbi:MAG: M24 family metallopeptidase [Muribaculaceae bacterium]|nr:M24 family metallopeptidase [Muribaculaceae bacterium]
MKKNAQYLANLRLAMKEHAIDCVIISGTDPHQSELPPMHWRGREWLTGFESENGTNGTAVVMSDKAYVWTDSRYFIQATEQLRDTGFEMMKEDGPDAVNLIDWVTEHLNTGQTVAIDGMTFSISWTQRLEQELNDNGIRLNDRFTPFDTIWTDRPERPKNKLFVHDEKIVGETTDSKITRLMQAVKGELANAILLSALDDIAWATNLRTAGDIAFSPIFVAYLYVDDNRRILFIDKEKLSVEVDAHLSRYGIDVMPYDSVLDFAATLPKETRLLIDPEKTSRSLYDSLSCTPVFGGGDVAKLKSVKNATMIENIKTAMRKDGVALTRFFMMAEREYPGTTDITRTIALGTPTAEQRHDFTLVLKGHIALSRAVFPKGTRGTQLDALARQYLWAEGKAYYHGTGHGVGFFINCHEGPQGIRLNDVPTPLEPGMILSNEPGLYLEGEYGIRTENLLAVEPFETTRFGDFYRFETLTLFPYDTSLIEKEIMTPEETEWVNAYHRKVYAELSPLLDNEEQKWLAGKCKEI